MSTETQELLEEPMTERDWTELNELAHRAAAASVSKNPDWCIYLACAGIAHERRMELLDAR